VRGIPNTPENRKFWEDLRQLTKESDSQWTLRIRGRRPSPDRIQIIEGCDAEEAHQSAVRQNRSGFVPLDIAEIFSVYAERRESAREAFSQARWDYNHGEYKRGVIEGKRQAEILDGQHGCTSKAELLETINNMEATADNLRGEIDRLKQQVQTQDEILEQRDILVNEMLTENYELKRQRGIKTTSEGKPTTITITIS
jgi:hypothetical protein